LSAVLTCKIGAGLNAAGLHGLDRLLLRFGDAGAGLGDLRLQLRHLAVDVHGGALQLVEAVDRDQLLVPQVAHALAFGLDQVALLAQGVDLGLKPGDLLVVLRDARAKLCAQLALFGLAHREQVLFVGHGLARAGLVEAVSSGGKNLAQAQPLCLEPGLLGQQLFHGEVGIGRIGAGHAVVEPHQQLALAHMLAIDDRNGRDHPPVGWAIRLTRVSTPTWPPPITARPAARGQPARTAAPATRPARQQPHQQPRGMGPGHIGCLDPQRGKDLAHGVWRERGVHRAPPAQGGREPRRCRRAWLVHRRTGCVA
jgi:hypothetical protein